MPYTYGENGVKETDTDEQFDSCLTILCDNFFQYIFQKRNDQKIDYGRLKEVLSGEQELIDSFYFFQKTTQNKEAYDNVVTALEATGWDVINPVPQEINDPKYGSFCETTALQTKGVERYLENKEKCNEQSFILCINHLYYYPLVHFLTQKEDAYVTIVCDKDELNDVFFSEADEIVNMLDMEISYVED